MRSAKISLIACDRTGTDNFQARRESNPAGQRIVGS
jgi:hypothetical protein